MRYLLALSGVALLSSCNEPTRPTSQPTALISFVVTGGVSRIDLGTLGGSSSFATDISNGGVVVGRSVTASGETHAFRWTSGGGMVDLGTLPGDDVSAAVAIRDGRILGGSSSSVNQVTTAVYWDEAGLIHVLPIAPIAGALSWGPSHWNSRGEIVGDAVTGDGNQHGWYWSSSVGTLDLRDSILSCSEQSASEINDHGWVVGTHCAPTIGWFHGFIWRRGEGFTDLGIVGDDIANANVAALAINNSGTVAGWIDPDGNVEPLPFLWTRRNKFTLLPVIPGTLEMGIAHDVNERGVAVGSSYDRALDATFAVAWPKVNTLVRLDSDLNQASAQAINNRGQIAGNSFLPGGVRATLWTITGSGQSRPIQRVTSEGENRPRDLESVTGVLTARNCVFDPKARVSKAAYSQCVWERM